MNQIELIKKIENFLILNGWKSERETGDEYFRFYKPGNFSIDVGNDEIIFNANEGDVCLIPFFKRGNAIFTYYAMIGYMVSKRLLAIDFKEN